MKAGLCSSEVEIRGAHSVLMYLGANRDCPLSWTVEGTVDKR
jgi:hypothetical protein